MTFVNGPQMIRDISTEVAKYGIPIVYSPGWENRGNGLSWIQGGPRGIINHHTAGGNNNTLDQNLINGVNGLQGPLCNWAGLWGGGLAVVAAHPANHAGAAGGWDTAPLPRTGWFNATVLGLEIQYRGIHPMSDAQYRTMCVLNYVCTHFLGWPKDYICSKTHQGTSIEGKWDPGYAQGKTYDIRKIREDISKVGPPGPVTDPEKEAWEYIYGQFMGY